MQHITLDTGHVRWSPRAEVPDAIVRALDPHVEAALGGQAPVPGMPRYSAHAKEQNNVIPVELPPPCAGFVAASRSCGRPVVIVAGLDLLVGDASLVALARVWGTDRVPVSARPYIAAHLALLPPPLGFGPRPIHDRRAGPRRQHAMEPDRAGPSG